MQRTFTSFLFLVIAFTLIASPALARDGFDDSASADELRDKYEDGELRLLIVPGHEPDFGGAFYQGVYEREINVEIADELVELLQKHGGYEIVVARSKSAWLSELNGYFTDEAKATHNFVQDQKEKTAVRSEGEGIEEEVDTSSVTHAAARPDAALHLYGINRWANENDVDLVVHLHVNDAPDHAPNVPSQYSGYAVYVPDSLYGNHETSKELAEAVADRLDELSDVSTLPGEDQGIVPDRELIALGAFGTLNLPSVLIEYGYLTEPRFTLPEHRETVTKDAAYQTYLALQDFFDYPVANPRDVERLPTRWPEPEPTDAEKTLAALMKSLEALLAMLPADLRAAIMAGQGGSVPATPATPPTPLVGASTVDCTLFVNLSEPLALDIETERDIVKHLQQLLAKDTSIYPEALVTGYFGPLTEEAVKRFQGKHTIVSSGTPETTGYGLVGPRTAEALHAACLAL